MVERAETDAGVSRACQIGLEFCVARACALDRSDISEIDAGRAKLCPIGVARLPVTKQQWISTFKTWAL